LVFLFDLISLQALHSPAANCGSGISPKPKCMKWLAEYPQVPSCLQKKSNPSGIPQGQWTLDINLQWTGNESLFRTGRWKYAGP